MEYEVQLYDTFAGLLNVNLRWVFKFELFFALNHFLKAHLFSTCMIPYLSIYIKLDQNENVQIQSDRVKVIKSLEK